MKIKTSELIRPALDWVVAKCEDLPLMLDPMGFRKERLEAPQSGWWVWYGTQESMLIGYKPTRPSDIQGYSPSTDWAQGGPIIERERIEFSILTKKAGFIMAIGVSSDGNSIVSAEDPTYLTAAMRCYVASKIGDEIEIPDELVGQ